jgi:hypothetical protein
LNKQKQVEAGCKIQDYALIKEKSLQLAEAMNQNG